MQPGVFSQADIFKIKTSFNAETFIQGSIKSSATGKVNLQSSNVI